MDTNTQTTAADVDARIQKGMTFADVQLTVYTLWCRHEEQNVFPANRQIALRSIIRRCARAKDFIGTPMHDELLQDCQAQYATLSVES